MSIPASVPPPTGFQGKGGPRQREKEKKYGTALPLLLPESPLHPAYVPPPSRASTSTSTSYAGILSAQLVNPQCVGVLDRASASVWVENTRDMETLFNRGFFGKGTLSRSDPSWRKTRVELMKGGSGECCER